MQYGLQVILWTIQSYTISPFFNRKGIQTGRSSVALFIYFIFGNPLYRYQTESRYIKGIVVGDEEIKCIAFADDLTNILRDKEPYDSLSLLLNTYGKCSGLGQRQRQRRSLLHWLGSSYRNHEVLIEIMKFLSNHEVLDINNCKLKVNEPIKIPGIFFAYDQLKGKELNFDLTHWLRQSFLRKQRFLVILVVFRLDLGQISFTGQKCTSIATAWLSCHQHRVLRHFDSGMRRNQNFWRGKSISFPEPTCLLVSTKTRSSGIINKLVPRAFVVFAFKI